MATATLLLRLVLAGALDQPAATFELPKALNEVSALSASADGKTLWAVGDERGTLFQLSAGDGAVVQTFAFAQRGDFEAVEEIAPGRVVVGRSDGRIYEVDLKDPAKTTHFDSKVGPLCDLEGLAWLAAKKRLLLACKNPMLSKNGFAIYALDLETKALDPEPWAVIPQKALRAYVSEEKVAHAQPKAFGPSGLAVHPTTGEVYVVSSTGRMLVVLGPDGALRKVEGLARDVHRHPEGICFSADGTLFISNEARGGRPVIQRFAP